MASPEEISITQDILLARLLHWLGVTWRLYTSTLTSLHDILNQAHRAELTASILEFSHQYQTIHGHWDAHRQGKLAITPDELSARYQQGKALVIIKLATLTSIISIYPEEAIDEIVSRLVRRFEPRIDSLLEDFPTE